MLIGGQDFRIYEIPADRELHGIILEGETAFWRYVTDKTPPPIDFESPRASDVLRRLYPSSDGSILEADESLCRWRQVAEEAAGRAALYESVDKAARAHLLAAMGEASYLKFPDGKALRRQVVNRKGYTVEPTSYMDARFINWKE